MNMGSHPPARRIALASLFIVAMWGCGVARSDHIGPEEFPTDLPLSEFVIGHWKSVSAQAVASGESYYSYEVQFVDGDTVKLAWFSPEGEFVDGTTGKYAFVDSDTLSIVDRRVRGDQTWDLQRNGDGLIVIRSISGMADRIVLVRE